MGLVHTILNSEHILKHLNMTINSIMDTQEPTVKTKKTKCFMCKKKSLMIFNCRCEKLYCISHQSPEIHDCSFDYKKMHKADLKEKLIKVVAPKIIKI